MKTVENIRTGNIGDAAASAAKEKEGRGGMKEDGQGVRDKARGKRKKEERGKFTKLRRQKKS